MITPPPLWRGSFFEKYICARLAKAFEILKDSGYVAAELINVKPDVKALISSGFSDKAIVKETQGLGAGGFIKKPYSVDSFLRIVRGELKKAR